MSTVQFAIDLVKSLPASLARDVSWWMADRRESRARAEQPYAVTEEQKRLWRERGWLVLERAIPDDAIERFTDDVARFRRNGRGGRDDHGHGVRIGLLHAERRAALRFALNEAIRGFMRWALDGEPVLFGSLTFDVGSEQEPHMDAAFFYTQPENAMAAAWIALEDVDADSGPLFYVDGSHRFPRLYASEVLERNPELAQRVMEHRKRSKRPDYALSELVYQAYSKRLQERLAEANAVRQPALIKKGDVFVWDGWLVHGGMPRLNRALTRRSMVVHYIRSGCRFWDQHAFFLRGDVLESTPPVNFRFRRSPLGRYIKYHHAVTFDGGNGHFQA